MKLDKYSKLNVPISGANVYLEGYNKGLELLDKIRSEIEEKYSNCDICEWFEDYDYEENDISEYQQVGDISDILAIIDKYRAEVRDNGGLKW